MGGQFPPENGWSVCSGKQPKNNLFRGGQFPPESGGQFDRILQLKTKTGKWRVNYQPKMEARVKVMDKIRDVFKRYESQPLTRVRDLINPILRGWVQYFRIGHSGKAFGYVKDWLTKKIRRHLMRAKGKQGFGWKQWSTKGLYATYNIYGDFKVTPRKFAPI